MKTNGNQDSTDKFTAMLNELAVVRKATEIGVKTQKPFKKIEGQTLIYNFCYN